MKDVTSHSQLSGHFTNFRRKKEKENAEKIPAIPEQQDLLGEKLNHHHLNICSLRLVDLHIMRINAFDV